MSGLYRRHVLAEQAKKRKREVKEKRVETPKAAVETDVEADADTTVQDVLGAKPKARGRPSTKPKEW